MDTQDTRLSLTDFVDQATLQQLQDRFAAVAHIGVGIEHIDGAALTRAAPAASGGASPAPSGASHKVPIVVGGHPIARLVLDADGGTPIPTETIEFADVLASTIARLCAEEQQLRHRVDELAGVYEMASMLAGTYDLQQVLDRTTAKVCEVLGVAACSIRLLGEDRNQLRIRAVHNLSQAYVEKGPVTVSRNPIDAQALAGRAVFVEDAPSDPRTQYPAQAASEGIVSGLTVGMMHHGRPVGVVRAYTNHRHQFSPFEVALLRGLAAQAAAAIVNVELHREAREAGRITAQVKAAAAIQRRMIPDHAPDHAAVEFGAAYDPSFDVGGDFYDYIALPWGHVGICIADVVGKGVPAALMMASLRSALRVYAHTVYDIDEIIRNVNRHFHRDTLVSEFATLFYGVLTPDGRSLTYCNAGHNPPILIRGKDAQFLETGGMVVGVYQDSAFEKDVVVLEPGDVLLLFTDGVIDAVNFADEQYGDDRLLASLRAKIHMPAHRIATDLLWDVRRFVGLAPQADDLTLVVMKVL